MKERSHAFDLLCGICILRMITAHCVGACGFDKKDWWLDVMQWTYFFMCFFFFKAGFFNKTIGGSTWAFVKDKTRRLLVPYFSWGAIGSVVFFFFTMCIFPPSHATVKALRWSHVWEVSGFWGNPPLWFLMSFFMTYVVAHLLERVPAWRVCQTRYGALRMGVVWTVVVFPFVSYWLCKEKMPLWLSLGNVFMGVFLFEMGRLWRRVMDAHGRWTMVAVSVVMIGAFVALNATHHGYKYAMSSNLWQGTQWELIPAIVCITCGLSGLLEALRVPRIPGVCYIGEHSMVYFVSHYVVITFYQFTRSAFTHTIRGHWDDLIFLLILCFMVSTVLVPWVEKVELLSGRYGARKHKLWII